MTHQTLLFTQDAFYNGQLKYAKGSSHSIAIEGGEVKRWLSRGVAEVVGEAVAVPAVVVPAIADEAIAEEAAQELATQEKIEVIEQIAKPKSKKENKKNSTAVKEL